MRSTISGLLRHRRLGFVKELILFARGVAFLGRRFRCPCCGWNLRGFVGRWGLLRSSTDGYCPRCNAKARHRRAWMYLGDQVATSESTARVLDVAPWSSFARCARRDPAIRYLGLDLEPTGPQVDIVGDVTSIPTPATSFDIVVCVHVLEHVVDDGRAMAELYRTVRRGGFALVTVPLLEAGTTYEDPTVVRPEDRRREFGERGHVRFYGMDVGDRLTAAGFEVRVDDATSVAAETRRRFGLRDDDHIFHCSKPEAATSPA